MVDGKTCQALLFAALLWPCGSATAQPPPPPPAQNVSLGGVARGGATQVDGVLSPYEWDGADTVAFPVRAPEGSRSARLLVMNDGQSLWLAIQIDRPSIGFRTSAFVDFDRDDDGVIERRDDQIGVEAGASGGTVALDGFFVHCPGAPPGTSGCAIADTREGGTLDARAAVRGDGTTTTIEIEHPLRSEDGRHDFALGFGDTVGFRLRLRLDASSSVFTETEFPSGRGHILVSFAEALGSSLATCDFNGDGFSDLAIGAPYTMVRKQPAAGAVHVRYGCPDGLALCPGGDQVWSQDSPGIRDGAETGDLFGHAMAAADFNRDGFCDLAVGAHAEGVGRGAPPSGRVHVIFGSRDGLSASGNLLYSESSPIIGGVAEAFDAFGSALAAGDFDGDGFADLAIGAPGKRVGGQHRAGMVAVLYGCPVRFCGSSQGWSQDSAGVLGRAEDGDYLGHSLTRGDFNNDGLDDLAVGVPFEDVDGQLGAGAVNVLYGCGSQGLCATGNQLWSQAGLNATLEPGDFFGSALTAGDFNNDGQADLAIGVPRESIGNLPSAGAVNILYGCGPAGLCATGHQTWHQDSPGIAGSAEAEDLFGLSLAVGDFNGDGLGDLAIGVPKENIGVQEAAGFTNVILGCDGQGLCSNGNQGWRQVPPKRFARWSQAVATGDFNDDGFSDLAIGIPGSRSGRGGWTVILSCGPEGLCER